MYNPIFNILNINYKENIYGNKTINVFFLKDDNNLNKVLINCFPYEKVSDLIQRYIEKTGDNYEEYWFFYNGRKLDPSLSVEENNIYEMSRIFVSRKNSLMGRGCPIEFTDVSKNKTKEIKLSKYGPSYRTINKGINIFGICLYKRCEAYKKEVIVRINKRKFDLIKDREELFCPECESLMSPKTVGFYLCKFRISGKKIEGQNEVNFQNMDDEANNINSFKYFDPELNGETKMTELIFEVLEYF